MRICSSSRASRRRAAGAARVARSTPWTGAATSRPCCRKAATPRAARSRWTRRCGTPWCSRRSGARRPRRSSSRRSSGMSTSRRATSGSRRWRARLAPSWSLSSMRAVPWRSTACRTPRAQCCGCSSPPTRTETRWPSSPAAASLPRSLWRPPPPWRVRATACRCCLAEAGPRSRTRCRRRSAWGTTRCRAPTSARSAWWPSRTAVRTCRWP
mmetsp:Transcript_99484/g.297223  ORF Transcript_99484/g.297223 Transcript_99484/m.297223 type:complete len:212 (-) Transcript_99484:357-992(-)